MNTALYFGSVYHRRFAPKDHAFSYPIYMMYLDVDELNDVTNKTFFCSKNWWSPLRFKRSDFHGSPEKSIKHAVYETVKSEADIDLSGPVRVLNQWRCFGFNFNPLSTYYCFDAQGEHVVAILAEVTNTPWLDRQAYVLPIDAGVQDFDFDKRFTVSPFNPVNMQYHWQSTLGENDLKITIDAYQSEKLVLKASMSLRKEALTSSSLRGCVLRFPLSTYRVVSAIYWQALKLFLKRVPFLGKDKISQYS